MSVNHFERQALLCGYSVERMSADYGVDLTGCTYTEDGQIENEPIKVQLKATDNLTLLNDGATIALSFLRSDLEFWLAEWMPVILVLYDAATHTAYWLCAQAYFQRQSASGLSLVGETVTLYFNASDRLDEAAMRRIARLKNEVAAQWNGETRYEIYKNYNGADGTFA